MPIANTYFDHFARYGYTLIVKLDNCRTNFETSINTNNHYISNSMFTLQGCRKGYQVTFYGALYNEFCQYWVFLTSSNF